jgi:hypothetical protein
MAKVSTKSSKKVKKVKPGSSVAKSRTRPGLTERNAKRVKVESGVKSLPKAKHVVRVMSRQVREIYGYVAEETASTVVFKTRAFIGASRKAQYLHIDRADIVLFEGKVGKASRAFVRAPQLLAEYKDVTVSYKGDNIVLKTPEGDEVQILNQNIPGITVEISGDASE